MKKWNLRAIMRRAWATFKKGGLTFSESLHRAWLTEKAAEVNEARIRQAAENAGISEEYHTWSEWQKLGRMVIHGSKAVFGCDLIHGRKGDGAIYKARFFLLSQTEPIEAVE